MVSTDVEKSRLSEEATKSAASKVTGRHALYVAFIVASGIITWKFWLTLALYSFHEDSYSHILLIPLVSFFLIYGTKDIVFVETQSSIGLGTAFVSLGLFAFWLANRHRILGEDRTYLFQASLSILSMWTGGFLLCYGRKAARAALFPLMFLLLMVPLPDVILARVIHLLEEGSTAIAFLIFKAAGVPVFRQGFVLSLPTVSIEVASECSSIRSSIALLITCVLAARFFLRTTWRAWLFVALVVPLSVLKNGIRIATLTLLSIYVDPRFLTGSLHREGGFVFFFLALAMLWPVLLLLQRSERGARNPPG